LLLAVLAAFPDRVARRRRPRSDEVVFAAGGSGRILPCSIVSEAEYLVAVDAEERARGQVGVRVASAIEPDWLIDLFPDRVVERREVRFDATAERVEATESLSYDGLVLAETVSHDVDHAAAGPVLARAALEAGVARLWDADAIERLRARVAFASEHVPGLAPIDDEAVTAAVAALCADRRSFSELRRASLADALLSRLSREQVARLGAVAPDAVSIPGRARVPVRYERGAPPSIASRLQDFFGATTGPAIAGGAVPLVLHLLAPSQRPVQVTTDLAGFWDRHYPSIRSQLMRRYPKHAWPEDPRSASPGSRAARRR
jgi:ATP-dependent helicase HrpB